MSHHVKLFQNGRSQAVRLPVAFRFETDEVYIRKDEETGDVILSSRPDTWDDFFGALKGLPQDFLDKEERIAGLQERDPLAGWNE